MHSLTHTVTHIPSFPAMPSLQLHETLALPDFTHFNADHSLPPSPSLADAVAYALQKCPGFKFLPSNYDSLLPPNASPASAHFACDDFRIYEFKVRRCMRGRSHDWTECPFAHPGEKARRRDPRRIHYSGSPCPDFRKGSCRRGDACEFAHGVFECWLHPARYRTQVCKDGQNCKRRVCFFAHSPEQLRILPPSTGACDAASTHSLTDKADSSENTPNEAFLPNSVGTLHAHQFNSPSAMSSPLSPAQMSPISMQQLDSPNGSALRRAMVQNLLACKGYGVNLNTAEYSPARDGYEMLAEAQTMRTSHHRMQPLPIMNGQNESLFSRFNLPIEKSSYELGSHGFASPTSTLASHIFSPPPLSPPLSPLTSPNSNIIKESFSNPGDEWHSYYVNDTMSTHVDPTFAYNNMSYMEDLGLSLQNLHIVHTNEGGYISQSPCSRERAGQVSIPTQKSRQPFKHSASNLSCVSNQTLWGSASDFASSNGSNFDYLGVDDGASGYEVGAGKVGEESTNIDNSIPDLGWVSELVK